MAKKHEEVRQEDKPLSIRERIAMHVLFLIMHIVKPSEYSHEWDRCQKHIEEELTK